MNLVTAMYSLNHHRFKEISFFICRHNAFASVWHDIFELLAKVTDEEVENFFIEYLINADINRTDIKKIIDDYLGGL